MRKKVFKIGLYLILIICGYMIHKTGVVNKIYQKYLETSKTDTYKNHVELAKNTTPHSIELLIPDKKLQLLNEQRRLALELGPYYQENPRFTGYVKGKMVFGGDTVKIKLRLKGLFPDHYDDSLKCSYKIKIRGSKTFLGMKKFAIQHPKTREYINEWYLHKLFEYVGITHLRYGFINVTINGRNSGVYAIEENMHKNLIENNQMKEGPIFRFNIAGGTGPMFFRSIKPYGSGRLHSDSTLLLQYEYAKKLLYEFRDGIKKTSEIFDVKKTAKFFALIDLSGHHHASHPHNLKFYFNPVTSLIEPIGYDNSSFLPLENEGLLGNLKNVVEPVKNRGEIQWRNDPLSERLFNDTTFFKSYMDYLQEYSMTDWLTSFFKINEQEAQEQLQTIWKSYPEYNFLGKEILFHNQDIIKQSLESCSEPIIRNNSITRNNNASFLWVKNQNSLPLELVSVIVNNDVFNFENVLLEPNYINERPKYIPIQVGSVLEDSVNVQLKYRFFGVDSIHTFIYKCNNEEVKSIVISEAPIINNISKFSVFESLISEDGVIEFKKGEYLYDEDFIIPSGYLVKVNPGVKINLVNGAKIISQSPFIVKGTEVDSVLIYSSDNTGEGIFILNTNETSRFDYCKFRNLSNLMHGAWKLSGAVNFYKAGVSFTNCEFSLNLRGDDMLNIMNTTFEIKKCNFYDVLADALDGDFTTGNIEECTFYNIGNDAMDFSGSSIDIKSCNVSNVEDKALSVGEETKVNIDELTIKESNIALTAKDNSSIIGNNVKIMGSELAVCAFQKKSQFGPATITLTNSSIIDSKVDELIEKKSSFSFNGIVTEKKHDNVGKLLYGNVYGKMTVK